MIVFHSPIVLIFIPVIIFLFFFKKRKKGLIIPSIQQHKGEVTKNRKYKLGKIFTLISLILFLIALARPQRLTQNKVVKKDGIDIMISLDVSYSMLKYNRLEIAKDNIKRFIDYRTDDRIGLVVFGREAYTKFPLTFDTDIIKKEVSKIDEDTLAKNNMGEKTAIGSGLGVSINRLKNSDAKSKIVILLTDGENNSGNISPEDAGKLAEKLGVKLYIIGISTYSEILSEIAKNTSGQYFNIQYPQQLNEVFKEIDKLEKSKIDNKEYYEKDELFKGFLIAGLIFLTIGIYYDYRKYIRIP